MRHRAPDRCRGRRAAPYPESGAVAPCPGPERARPERPSASTVAARARLEEPPGRGAPTSRSGSTHSGSSQRPPGCTARGKPRRSLPRRLAQVGACSLRCSAFVLLGGRGLRLSATSTDVPDPNEDFQAQTTFVYYSDGKHEIGRFASQNRTSVPLSEVPDHVQEAVVAAENRTFWTNRGSTPRASSGRRSATPAATPPRAPRRSPSSTSRSSTSPRSRPSPARSRRPSSR